MALNVADVRQRLADFDFKGLFTEELGWSQPTTRRPETLEWQGEKFELRQISQLAGVAVFEVVAEDGKIPYARTRAVLQREIARHHHENLLIFLDKDRTQSLWYWVKRDGTRRQPRDHSFFRGQPGDLFLSKISAMFVDIGELDEEGNLSVIEAARRLQQALDVEPVTKKFYTEFRDERLRFMEYIEGIRDEQDRRWYASVLLNRLMFIYFLQRKGFLDGGNFDYLQDKLREGRQRGPDRYYRQFLSALFFEGFAKPEDQRRPQAQALLGDVRYLNGGLFLQHTVEVRYPNITIPDVAFENLLRLFGRYSWNLDDTPGGKDDELNPDVLVPCQP